MISTANETEVESHPSIALVNVDRIISTTIGSLFIAFIFLLILALIVWRRKQTKKPRTRLVEPGIELQLIPKLNETEVKQTVQKTKQTITKADVVNNWKKLPQYLFSEEALPAIPRSCIKKRKMLGKGEFGIVYEGLMTRLPKSDNKSIRVAIKTLLPNHTEHMKIQFLKEAQFQRNFKHRNIVKFLGVCFQEDLYWIILELMDDTLSNYLQSVRPTKDMPSQVSLNDLLMIIRDIVDGCIYLEATKRIHGDLAARNCLVAFRDNKVHVVKIADFGISHAIYPNEYVQVKNIFVPCRWAAPECLMGQRYTQKIDIWSFGVLLWEIMKLGEMPYINFEYESVGDMVQFLKIGGRLKKPHCCPDEMYEIMQMCWKLDPKLRPSFILLKLKFETLKWFEQYNTNKPFPTFDRNSLVEPMMQNDNTSKNSSGDFYSTALGRYKHLSNIKNGKVDYTDLSFEEETSGSKLEEEEEEEEENPTSSNKLIDPVKREKNDDSSPVSQTNQLALKIIYKQYLHDKGLFAKEIEQLKKLDHPNVVKLLDVFDDAQHIYLLIGPVFTVDLFSSLIESKQIYTEIKAVNLLKQILTGIHYMHQNNVVHRNLKPDNIFLTSTGEDSRIVISGFGLASVNNPLSFNTEKFGYLNYYAPEVLLNKQCEKPMDIWSLGVIAYIMLSGCYPFYDKDHKNITKNIITGSRTYDPLYWKNISYSAKDFINRLLQVDTLHRETSLEALHHPWLNSDKTSTVDIYPTVSKQLKRLWVRQKWRKACNAVLAINQMKNLCGPRSPYGFDSEEQGATAEDPVENYFEFEDKSETEETELLLEEVLPCNHILSRIPESQLNEIFSYRF